MPDRGLNLMPKTTKLVSRFTGGPLMLWFGIGSGACMSALGYSYFVCQLCNLFFLGWWMHENMDTQHVVRQLFNTVLDVFFRDFDVAGEARIPDTGPIILACAPHANQFIDGFVCMKAVSKRDDIGFLTAAITMRRKWVGKLAHTLKCIPVERPQDLAQPGVGTVTIDKDGNVSGHDGTHFTRQCRPNDQLAIKVTGVGKITYKITSVQNDSEMKLAPLKPDPDNPTAPIPDMKLEAKHSFKVIPHLDQSDMFEFVFDKLGKGGGVAIFPEGGSHDRTELLPLKAGISIMALGTMAKYPDSPVTIFPVGLNYFKGHRFRSRVFVDIGEPIVVSQELADQYIKGGDDKRNACNALLNQVIAGIRTVTVEAPNFDALQFLRACRRMYVPDDDVETKTSHLGSVSTTTTQVTKFRLGPQEKFTLTKSFSQGYKATKDHPKVKELYNSVLEYRGLLRAYNIPDHRVAKMKGMDRGVIFNYLSLTPLLLSHMLYLLFYTACALPGIVLAIPMLILTRRISKAEAAKALKESSVKVAGRDVIATWKVLVACVLVPVMHFIYTGLAWLIFGRTTSVIYFWCMPMISGTSILATENYVALFTQTHTLMMTLINPDKAKHLSELREGLQRRIRSIVAELGWDELLKADDSPVMKQVLARVQELVARDTA